MIKIEKDSKLKKSLKNKKQDNAFTNIKKLSKITYKVNKIKIIQNTVKKK